MSFDFADDLLAEVYKNASVIEDQYTEQLFKDEASVKKETINSNGVNTIRLESVYGAIYVEASPDADIHLAYPEEAHFTISHDPRRLSVRPLRASSVPPACSFSNGQSQYARHILVL